MRQQYEIRADVTTVERDFRRAWYRVAWASSIEDEDRPLHVSPFLGAYGRCGLVLAINGTPPAGLLLWNAQTQRVYMLGTLRVKTIAALTVLAGALMVSRFAYWRRSESGKTSKLISASIGCMPTSRAPMMRRFSLSGDSSIARRTICADW